MLGGYPVRQFPHDLVDPDQPKFSRGDLRRITSSACARERASPSGRRNSRPRRTDAGRINSRGHRHPHQLLRRGLHHRDPSRRGHFHPAGPGLRLQLHPRGRVGEVRQGRRDHHPRGPRARRAQGLAHHPNEAEDLTNFNAGPSGKRRRGVPASPGKRGDGLIPARAGRIMSAAGTSSSTASTATTSTASRAARGRFHHRGGGWGRPGIYTALAEAAETMRRGSGVKATTFPPSRPEGAWVKGTDSRASALNDHRGLVVHAPKATFDQSCETG